MNLTLKWTENRAKPVIGVKAKSPGTAGKDTAPRLYMYYNEAG
jgi:hypothetical protein